MQIAHGYIGHIDWTCFQQGGGMEGHCEEYMSNKSHIHAMFTEYFGECVFIA